jgi:hypothetical protein
MRQRASLQLLSVWLPLFVASGIRHHRDAERDADRAAGH